MAAKLEAQFLGTPVIRKDGEEVFFSYNKVNALVYYILVRGTVMRDELSGILWADKPDVVARKNLRNAIYEAKKILGADTFISPRKAIIKVNPDVDFEVDSKIFEADPMANLELYRGDFLQGFFIKDSVEYEDWYLGERNRLKGIYMDTIGRCVREAAAQKDYGTIERYGKLLISYNPYDESLYAIMLRAYCDQGKMQQCMELYEEMKSLFRKELQSDVPPEIDGIIKQALQKEETAFQEQEDKQAVSPGREGALDEISSHMWSFLRGRVGEALLLLGDEGSGKTDLVDLSLHMVKDEVTVIKTNCYQQERKFLLHPWTGIVEGLVAMLQERKDPMPDFDLNRIYTLFPQMDMSIERDLGLMEIKDILKFDSIFHTLSSVLDIAAADKKLIIVFEDIQWMDPLSLSLLNSLILRKRSDRIMFYLTARESREKDFQHFITSVAMYKRLHITELNPLTKKELRRLAERFELPMPVDDELVERLKTESEGNLFLATECLNSLKNTGTLDTLTNRMTTHFKAGYLSLTEEQQKLVDFIALFLNGAPLSMMSDYMKFDNLRILERLEELESKGYITPMKAKAPQPEVMYEITQPKLKEFIQGQLSKEKWRILHGYLATLWEKRLTHSKQDISIYQHLEYHYEQAGELIKMCHYKLRSLMYFLNFSHELFPVLSAVEPMQTGGASYFTESDTLQYLADVDALMERIRTTYGTTTEVRNLELVYLHLVGRYFIREGKYEKGVRYILDLIEQATEMHNRDYTLMGYKQMIYYDIQIGNTEEMRNYLEIALDLAVECNYHKEVGILLRLKGLNMIMQGDFVEAERLLNESISTFMVTQTVARRYALNIAAAYNYIGEIRRGSGQFEEAISYYDKALDICSKQQAYSSWVVFSCNAGIAAYSLGQYDRAKTYFEQAYTLFSRYDFYWRRPIVEAYLALLAVRDGRDDDAIQFLDGAMAKLALMNNPQEVGYVNMAIAMLKQDFPKSKTAKHYRGSVTMYSTRALRYLDKHRDTFERQKMEAISGTDNQ